MSRHVEVSDNTVSPNYNFLQQSHDVRNTTYDVKQGIWVSGLAQTSVEGFGKEVQRISGYSYAETEKPSRMTAQCCAFATGWW